MDDFNQHVKNCETFGKKPRYREILTKANGKNHYTEIAKQLDLHPTKVSSALRLAEKYGLAEKNKKGFYQKKPGVFTHIPKTVPSEKKNSEGVSAMNRVTKKKKEAKKITGAVVSNRVANSANKMMNAYNHLYITENALRELIRKVMTSTPNWWKSKVPQDVKDNVTKEMGRVPYHAAARHDELEHTHLGELAKIIMKNWNMFAPFLHEQDKNKFNAIIGYAIPHRNAVGHCIPLKTEHLKTVEIRFQDILNMIK